MKFSYEPDITDALVMIDESSLNDIDEDTIYSFEIYLDRYGKSELVYDFPDEKWDVVRDRESRKLRDFCNSGKMVVFLTDKDEADCEIQFTNKSYNTDTFLDVNSGRIILLNASEMIQCLLYPELEMIKILEINDLQKGTYAVEYNGIRKICCKRCEAKKLHIENVIEC